MEAIRKVLSEHPFFQGLSAVDLDLLTGLATYQQFESEEFVFREGEKSDLFYVILQGRVALETFAPDRGPIIISTLSEGEVMGWTWILEPFVHRYDAQALEYTRVLALDGSSLRSEFEHYPLLGYELLKRFAQVMVHRLEATRLQLLDMYGIPEPRRRPH